MLRYFSLSDFLEGFLRGIEMNVKNIEVLFLFRFFCSSEGIEG
jgi:hypothetical protein